MKSLLKLETFSKEEKNKLFALLNCISQVSMYEDRAYLIWRDSGLPSETAPFVNQEALLNFVYYMFLGESEKTVYKMFSMSDTLEMPIARYARPEWSEEGSLLKAPFKGAQGGFIPDEINNLLLNNLMSVSTKYRHLRKMFGDLVKIQQKFIKEKQRGKDL